MEAPQMRGVEEPLLPEPRAVEGGATQSEGAIETQEARYPRLHKTAGLRSLDVWVEISRAADRREVRLCRDVGRQERGVLRGDQELVQVSPVAVARADAGHLAVRVVEDHVLADAVPGHDLTLPPGEHGSPPVALDPEVPGRAVLAIPYELPLVVDDHRAVLACALLQGDEDVAGGGAGSPPPHLDGGRAKVGARAEGPHAFRRRGLNAGQWPDPRVTQGANPRGVQGRNL